MTDIQQWLVLQREGASAGEEAESLQTMLDEKHVELVEIKEIAGRQIAIIRTTNPVIEQLKQLHADQLMIVEDSNLSMF